jgi:hypothetical protein
MNRKRAEEPTKMSNMKAFATAAAAAVLAGALFVPAGSFARGPGGFGAAHGPVFGLHAAGLAGHRAFRPALARHAAPLRWWRLHRFAARNRGTGALWPLAADGAYAPYDANDVTAAIPVPGPAGVLAPPPAPYPPEHIGCLARGYEVPAEIGGIVKVVVTRC